MRYSFYLFIISLSLWPTAGCLKDHDTEYSPLQLRTDSKLAPKVDAGPDSITVHAVDYFLLAGSASAENSIKSIGWAKVAGPSNFNILTPNAHETEVRDVVTGRYKFEYSVTDYAGLTGRDTIIVNVDQVPATYQQVYFRNQEWLCGGWDCQIEIPGMHNYVSPGSFFKVYIQRDNSNSWERIYYSDYTIDSDTLVVYMTGDGSLDTPDIRLDY